MTGTHRDLLKRQTDSKDYFYGPIPADLGHRKHCKKSHWATTLVLDGLSKNP